MNNMKGDIEMISILALRIVASCIFLAVSSYWIINCVSRIYLFKKYRRVAASHLPTSTHEESDNMFEQICHNHETEIRKYMYFLLINSTEVYGVAMAFIYYLASESYITFSGIESNQKLMLSNCSRVDSLTLNEFQLKKSLTLNHVLGALQNVADLFVVMLGVCLMNYLTKRIKQIQFPLNKAKIRFFVSFTFLMSSIIIGTSSISSLFLLHTMLFLITILIYFCIFLRTVKQFERTLLQRAGQRLAQFGSNKAEYQQFIYFKYTMKVICFGFMLIVVSTYLVELPGFLTGILFYPKCYFPLNFLPHYSPIITTTESIERLLSILFYVGLLGSITALLAAFIAFSPFICISVYIWINWIYEFKSGTSKIKYSHYTEELYQPLLQK